jgi:phage terminase large subunit-like protein
MMDTSTWIFTKNDLDTKSLAEILTQQTKKVRDAFLDTIVTDEQANDLKYNWGFWGRPKQFVPEDSYIHILAPGRGFGKTRASSEWVRGLAETYPGIQIGLVARTYGDVMKTMINGESGILSICPPDNKPILKKQEGVLLWPNGSKAIIYTADRPDQLRGPTLHAAAADELAAWNFVKDEAGTNAWDNLQLATREVYDKEGLIHQPQILVTTTPKSTKEYIALNEMAENPENPHITIVHGTSYENKSNLGEMYFTNLENMYGGTDLLDQELKGILLSEKEGSLWNFELINECTLKDNSLEKYNINRFIISIDPSVAEDPKDECGIIVGGINRSARPEDRKMFILEDASVKGPPSVWAKVVVALTRKYPGAIVIAERNQGGALVGETIKAATEDDDAPIKIHLVWSRNNKYTRASGVLLKYKTKPESKVYHCDVFPTLNNQMVMFNPETSKKSPDRLDAAVQLIQYGLITPVDGLYSPPLTLLKPKKKISMPHGVGTGFNNPLRKSRI